MPWQEPSIMAQRGEGVKDRTSLKKQLIEA
jgi:hypothetical protein